MNTNLPIIIQGGMGVAISDWRLARTVSQAGQLGVVSGTGISRVMISRLMDGDLNGQVRYALANFPFQEPVQQILTAYYIDGSKAPGTPYKNPPPYTTTPTKTLDRLTVIANFVEVFLAKEGHTGLVGINLMEKIQMPNMASLYGAMLAGVDYVIMGAGIPSQIAGILDKLANHEETFYRIDVHGAEKDDDYRLCFTPEKIFPGLADQVGRLKRPQFLPIIASTVLAQALLKRSEGAINGFVIEGPLAGGHNAPPRGELVLDELGEPVYTDKDRVDLAKMRQIGLPFWLAGAYGNPDQLQLALNEGAAGIQVGTAFAFCQESGMSPQLRTAILDKVLKDEVQVFTSPTASPTGFPFKVALMEGTMTDNTVYEARPRLCDLSFLRTPYKRPDGKLGYRCSAEPVKDYVRKGGQAEDTVGRICLCNNLAATAGFPQYRKSGYVEKPVVTTGNDLVNLRQFIPSGQNCYTAQDVIDHLLGERVKAN
ncbi:MAG: nitronate monooxygenase [Chloroflexota bacterium]